MSKAKLELIKNHQQKKETEDVTQRAESQAEAKAELTAEEASEAARFKALTSARAAQKFMIRRIMAELEGLDDISSAA